MKARLKRAVELLAGAIAWVQVGWVLRTTQPGDKIVVLDIDNTLADAWPSFLQPHHSQRARLAGLDVLPNVKAVLHDEPRAKGATVVYLSHRNLWEWPVTFKWLRANGFVARPDRVILVPSAAAKVPLLRRIARAREVTVWDDLSHGHETGAIEFYTDVIELLAGVSLTYRGWDDIVTLSGKGLERD